ncbi:6-phosphogluconolactonase [Desertihabitans brevis]|uniref:6-phosphogluconolactonase n=1 Tax=Desertihabitans brevis TaxID=2268447 RepID=A0A367YXK3_9ACTN|nr:6-phosphogluconolactonase [Desertihabitans brevis]RCK70558.1 6-phosphogluconolactonase [Desertihabitans brevis]
MPIHTIVHDDPEALVTGASTRLVERLTTLQQTQPVPQLCLTGGRIANRIYRGLAARLAGSELDGTRVELWWGDERFVPVDHEDRNAGEALAILAPALQMDPSRVHPMPAADGNVSIEDSADGYAAELGETSFDICLLGVGPDGHVASLFPGHPSLGATNARVVAVHEAPKPPAERLSLTLSTLNRSREVWFVVSGADKAEAVRRAHAGEEGLPAAMVRGTESTVWLIDSDAASQL